MKKIVRNMSTAESESFWTSAEQAAPQVQGWPDWKRAGVNVAQVPNVARDVAVVAVTPPTAGEE